MNIKKRISDLREWSRRPYFSLSRALNPKKAILPAPTFAEYEQALVSVGCEISRYYLKEENDFCIQKDYPDVLKREKPDIISCVIPIILQESPYLRTFWKKSWKPVPCREYLW